MARATNMTDGPHARIFRSYRKLPAWETLSLAAKVLLVEIRLDNPKEMNGYLKWSVRYAAERLKTSKDTARRALIELENKGWIVCEKVASFGGAARAAEYSVTHEFNIRTGEPPSHAYLYLVAENSKKRKASTVPEMRLHGTISRTQQAHLKDTGPDRSGPIIVSDALKKSRIFNK